MRAFFRTSSSICLFQIVYIRFFSELSLVIVMMFAAEGKVVDVTKVDCATAFNDMHNQIECQLNKELM